MSSPFGTSPGTSPLDFPVGFKVAEFRKIKILLLEGISQNAIQRLKNEEFQIETYDRSLPFEELKEKIADVHVLGIRSKTKITNELLDHAKKLLCIGCFCIGTDQVDLAAAERHAELIIGMVINLARKIGDQNIWTHSNVWKKTATGCFEIRGKTLGIVGYGHIGSQLSVLAESMGMKVIFYDVLSAMPLGNSTPMPDLKSLLQKADFVTLHVPDTPQTRNLIGQDQLALMKKGSYLLNASRGSVVVISDLVKALQAGHIAGAFIDVYPEEPEKNTDKWTSFSELKACPNVLLTPHVGGSTTEAQNAIGEEVAERFVAFIKAGSTMGAVNFPNLDLPYSGEGTHRILNIHQNKPGVLKEINNILSVYNVESQLLRTRERIGYLIADVNEDASDEIRTKIEALITNLRTRIVY